MTDSEKLALAKDLFNQIKVMVINNEDDVSIPWDDIVKLCDEGKAL